MSKPARRLGRGLSSVIGPAATPAEATPAAGLRDQPAGPAIRVLAIPVERIRANPMQPRRNFDVDSLQALARSLRERGTLQPIVVRPAENGYELIAGERRLRAARIAGLDEIPAIIRPARDEDLLELALIENILRADLNAIERARAYRSLQEQQGLTADEIADRMGEDRSTAQNYLRLLQLPPDVQTLVAEDKLGVGQAKALLAAKDPHLQSMLAQSAAAEGWSARKTEQTVTRHREGSAPMPRSEVRPAVRDMEQRLKAALGLRVQIREGRKQHSGRVVVHYGDLAEFERLVGLICSGAESESIEG